MGGFITKVSLRLILFLELFSGEMNEMEELKEIEIIKNSFIYKYKFLSYKYIVLTTYLFSKALQSIKISIKLEFKQRCILRA